MADGFTLEEAKQAIDNGSSFIQAFSQLGDWDRDGDALKAYFVYKPAAVKAPATAAAARDMGYTGDVCATCGGCRMKRAGVCLVCEGCGSTSGGCA